MANYSQLSYGSKGSEVKTLQELLKKNGSPDLAVDGDFGTKTQEAVKKYQQANGLTVDGIVGTNTWGALTKAQGVSSSASAPAETKAPSFENKPYAPSDTVAQAEALLQQHLQQKPGAYQSAWQTQLNDIISKIQNREKFSYDLNGDALYQQYKDQYTTQGKLAMMDAMGQAAAMTGGYGNSYAQAAGQQAYQGYLQQLNERVPELYQLALSQYNREEDALYNQASLLAGMEDQDYSRYRDQLNDYYTELDRLTNDSRYQAEQDYSKWADEQSFGYQQYRDQIGDQQWQAQFDEAKRQYDEQMALSKSKSAGSGNGTKYTGGGDYDNGDYGDDTLPVLDSSGVTPDQIAMIQRSLRLNPTGVWDEATAKAAGYTKASDAYAAWNKGTVGKSVNNQILAANKLMAKIKNMDYPSMEAEIYNAYTRGEIDFYTASEMLATVAEKYKKS